MSRLSIAPALLLLALSSLTTAIAEVKELDLGTHPANGQDALNGISGREVLVADSLACRDEFRFLQAIEDGEHSGNWPIHNLIAKAMILSTAGRFNPNADRVGCVGPEGDGDLDKWKKLFLDNQNQEKFPGAGAQWANVTVMDGSAQFAKKLVALQNAIGALYLWRFGDVCSGAAPTRELFTEGVFIQLSPACLMRQIERVIDNPLHGAWSIDNNCGVPTGTKTPRMPGTSAGKLPCPTNWTLVGDGLAPKDWNWPWSMLKGVEGDWDMSVILYTRLTYLLYRARAAHPELTNDADAALLKLNQWLLTLRRGPATETYQVFWSCGNPENSFGSAQDTMNGNDVYNKDLGQTVSGDNNGEDSFWKKLLKFLRFVAIAAAVGFTLGLVLGGSLLFGLAGAAVAAIVTVVVIVVASLFIAGIEETENHLLMQNTSKYLKNKLMMAELRAANDHDNFDKLSSDNEDVRKWLLKRISRIVKEDFVEYNARPYNRLSHESILNLVDYACEVSWSWDQAANPPSARESCDPKDQAIVTAASAAFDLSAAKIALGSSQGRRLIPYRRLMNENTKYRDKWQTKDHCPDRVTTHDPKRFLDMSSGADHMIAALQFWAATSEHGPNGHASQDSLEEMLWHASSRYRPHEMILDLALDRSTPIEQNFTHGGFEHYASGPGWLLTAGGETTHSAQGLRINILPFGLFGAQVNVYAASPTDDKGVGVPTSLMASGTASRRDTITELLRFEGTHDGYKNSDDGDVMQSFDKNKCVTGSFACGLRLEIPPAIDRCLQPAPASIPAVTGLRFLSSADCAEYKHANASEEFFLAVFSSNCAVVPLISRDDCGNRPWGFLEVASPAAFGNSLQQYEQALVSANQQKSATWSASPVNSSHKFWSVTQNREISFTPDNEDFSQDCRACGSIVRHESGARITINHPRRNGRIYIDLNDEMNPIRRGEGGVALAP